MIIEDKDFLESSMNGQSWMAGKFTSSLRLSLWAEHLGLRAGEVGCDFSLQCYVLPLRFTERSFNKTHY